MSNVTGSLLQMGGRVIASSVSADALDSAANDQREAGPGALENSQPGAESRLLECFFCGGPYHEATGAHYSDSVRACGPCVRHFYGWLKGFVKPRKGTDFYGKHNRADGVGPWKVKTR